MTSVLVQLQVIAEQRKMLMSNMIPNKTPKTRDENKILKFLLSSPRIETDIIGNYKERDMPSLTGTILSNQ